MGHSEGQDAASGASQTDGEPPLIEEEATVHVHKPKVVHSWREFVGEVGIIVVGVLIAIGAEQLVETVHKRHEAETSMNAIRLELAHAAGVYEERKLVEGCLEKRLGQLDLVLRAARRSGRLPDIGQIGRPPTRPIATAAWNCALANGSAMHFSDEERDRLSVVAAVSSIYSAHVLEEQDMWATLRVLEHAPGKIDGSLLADASTTLARLQFRTYLNGIDAEQQFDGVRGLGIRPDYTVTNEPGEESNRNALIARVRSSSVCKLLVLFG